MKKPGSTPNDRVSGPGATGTDISRLRTLYGKPKALTDRYDECGPEVAARLLATPAAEYGWNEFNMLYRVGVAPAAYEEGLYFLPDALAFLRRNPNDDAVHCVADVIWFLSEHARRLEEDGLLAECRHQIRDLLEQRLGTFVIIHWDRAKNREMGFDRASYDYVEECQLVADTLEALFRFRTLADWAADFLSRLMESRDQPTRSAWFLACVAQAGHWVLFHDAMEDSGASLANKRVCATVPSMGEIWTELARRGMVQPLPRALRPGAIELARHAEVLRRSGSLFEEHPTYWQRIFHDLGLSEGEPGQAECRS